METISELHPFTLLNCLIFLVMTINGGRPDSWVGCGEPGTPSNGIKYMETNPGKLQNEWTYKCDKGFALVGNSTRLCLPNGIWSPHPIPKCVSNLAYNKYVAKHAPRKRRKGTLSVEGDKATCSYQKEKCYGYIDMKKRASFDTVTIIVKEYESMANYVNISVTNDTKVALPGFNNSSALRPLCFDGTGKRTKSLICQQKEVAQYVVIYSNVAAYICDVAVYDSNEVMSCGKPDQPLHGRINKSDASFLEYECDVGYTVQLGSARHCYKGSWSPNLPHCTKSTPTDSKTDFGFTGIMGIGVGATGAFLIAFIGCFFVRRYYRSKSGNNNESDVYSEPHSSYDQRSANGSVSVHLYCTVNDLDCQSIAGSEQAALTPNHVNRDAATCAIYDNVGAQSVPD